MSDAPTDISAVQTAEEPNIVQAPTKKAGLPTWVAVLVVGAALAGAVGVELYATREKPPVYLPVNGVGKNSLSGAKGGHAPSQSPAAAKPGRPKAAPATDQ